MKVRQLSVSRRSLTIAAALAGVVSLAIGAHAALNKRSPDAAQATKVAQVEQADNASRIAVVETTDNGKLIREMEGQLRGLADYYHWYAGAADKIHGETIPADRTNFLIYTLKEPVSGKVGLWSKTDSMTEFSDFTVTPAVK